MTDSHRHTTHTYTIVGVYVLGVWYMLCVVCRNDFFGVMSDMHRHRHTQTQTHTDTGGDKI
jgi:hypothetical protein